MTRLCLAMLAALAVGCAAAAPPPRPPTPGNLTATPAAARTDGYAVARLRTLARDGGEAGVGRPHVRLQFAGGGATRAAALAAPRGHALGICDEAEFEVLAETDDAVRIAIVAPTAVVARWVPRANLQPVTTVATPLRRTRDEAEPTLELRAGAPLTIDPAGSDASSVAARVETLGVQAAGFVDRAVVGSTYLRPAALTPMLTGVVERPPSARLEDCMDHDNSFLVLGGPTVPLPAGTCLRDAPGGEVLAVARDGMVAVVGYDPTAGWGTATAVLELTAFGRALDGLLPDGGLTGVVPGTATSTGGFVFAAETCDIAPP